MVELSIAGLFGTLLGGISGGLAGYYLSNPKPKMRISNIYLIPVQPDISDENALFQAIIKSKSAQFLQTPTDILLTSRESIVVDGLQEYYQHPSQYTLALLKANQDNEMERLMRQNIPQVLKELRRTLFPGHLREFLLAWHPYHITFWRELILEHVRNGFDIPDLDESTLGSKLHQIVCDADGDYLVAFNNYTFNFAWAGFKIQKDALEPFAKKMAMVFAYEHVESFRILLEFLEKTAWDNPTIKSMSELICRELTEYSKLVIRGVVNNTGRTPIALSGYGAVTIKSKGFEYQSNSSTLTMNTDISVNMSVVKDNLLNNQHALVIKGGEAVFFEAHSKSYLYQLKDRECIQKLLGSERKCSLSLPRLDSDDLLSSSPVKFTEFSTDDIFRGAT